MDNQDSLDVCAIVGWIVAMSIALNWVMFYEVLLVVCFDHMGCCYELLTMDDLDETMQSSLFNRIETKNVYEIVTMSDFN
mgnify:CR=1 FL=1